jgi:uncharacterized Zn-binding protein involved in type VI secretion
MPVAQAARVGGRISHTVTASEHPSGAMASAVLGGSVVGPAGLGGASSAMVGASVGGSGSGAVISLRELLPLVPHGVVTTGVPGLFLGPGVQAVPTVDPSTICARHMPVSRQGVAPAEQPTVMVNGKPLARVGDLTTCGAFLCDGVPGVMVGGPRPPGQKVSLGDLGKALGGVALGAVLTQTHALERVTALGDALVGAVDKAADRVEKTVDRVEKKAEAVIDAATRTVERVEKKAEAVVDTATKTVVAAENVALSAVETAARFGEAVGSFASGALGALLGGAR